jgi:hypothetical protein
MRRASTFIVHYAEIKSEGNSYLIVCEYPLLLRIKGMKKLI